ncbi:MAG TPA: hypothetical protein VEZ48_06120 [Sphingomonadaceae bacterium]|nr:hypothetical protein [Sphingomonadaceae bacterium]
MRISMFLLVAATPMAVVLAAPAQSISRTSVAAIPGKTCKPLSPQWARGADGAFLRDPSQPVQFDLHQAVARSVDGCPVPAILRRDVDETRARNVTPDRGAVRLLVR